MAEMQSHRVVFSLVFLVARLGKQQADKISKESLGGQNE
jgi:hypothetical protein